MGEDLPCNVGLIGLRGVGRGGRKIVDGNYDPAGIVCGIPGSGGPGDENEAGAANREGGNNTIHKGGKRSEQEEGSIDNEGYFNCPRNAKGPPRDGGAAPRNA